jgi:EAL domain-containing protein (putative c-di-GMP-specific phosphodiesterase class I)
MYYAKNQGRNNYQFYADSIAAAPSERLALKGELSKALEREELMVYFQPQLLIDTKKIIGTEALLRWQHPELGLVPPAEIIPLAEESGLIEPISEWVIRTACRQNLGWQRAGLPPMRVSVNLSSLLLQQRKLVTLVSEVLNETGMAPSQLVIELTESNLFEDGEDTISVLRDLKEIGVRIAVDDFGTGNSSLYQLKNYPLDVLKIDRSLIKDIPSNSDSVAITTAIIAMAHSLQIEVIAVGVETDEQLDFLSERHCDALQGYLYSPPVPSNDLTQLFREEPVEMRM